MRLLKQNTAQTIKAGPFLDDADAVTEETGLTIAQADIRVSKDGGAFAQTNNTAGATHDENGFYGVPLDATDTNTLGELIVYVNVAGALPVRETLQVVPAHVYDGIVSGTDFLQVDTQQVGGATPTSDQDIVDELMAEVIDGTFTFEDLIAIQAAALAGKVSGAATTSVAIRNLADTLDRITATVDADGNRTGVTYDTSDL